MKTALLIIDMQKGSFTPIEYRHDSLNTIERINKLSAAFRIKKWPVIHIQHDGTKHGVFIKGNEDWKIIEELTVEESDFKIDKIANDAFYNSSLKSLLDQLIINDLVITGCATDFCVEATIQSALVKDYNIMVASDGHTTANRPHINAKQVIEHYNWVWNDMTPTNGNITVKPISEILPL